MRLLELHRPLPSISTSRTKYTEGKLAQIIRLLRSPGPWLDPDTTYIRLLQSCATLKALPEGKQVHSHLLIHGFKPNSHTWFTLISMYANCGSFPEALYVQQSMPQRTRDSWAALIAAYTHQGHNEEALQLFCEMVQENISANEAMVVFALNACKNLVAPGDGMRIHDYIIENGLEASLMVQNSLLTMYCKCYGLQQAEQVFKGMGERNVESWTAILAGYADHGLNDEAIRLFQRMLEAGMKPNKVTLVNVLKACTNMGVSDIGRDIHRHIKASGLGSDTLLNNLLISMYTKCGSIKAARHVFDQMPRKDIISWNAMIGGYNHHGLDKDAFKIFKRLKREVIKPDIVTVSRIITSCINLKDPDWSREIHHYIMKNGYKSNIAVLNNVLDMYINCAAIEVARQVFDSLPKRDVTTFNAMIRVYVQLEHCQEALKLFKLMQECRIQPDEVTFANLLNACAFLHALEQGKEIHDKIIRSQYESHNLVSNALIDMYVKCGSVECAFTKSPE